MEAIVKQIGAAFSVAVIPVLRDNYSYLIHDKTTGVLAVVDVSKDVAPVIDCVRRISSGGSTDGLRTILCTHKHADHSGGNITLQKQLNAFGSFRVFGGANDNIPGVTHTVVEGDRFYVGSLQVDVLDAPCHTRGHVLYKLHNPALPKDGTALFTGDTMFIGGIGAFFEGDAALMCRALRKIYDLNKDVTSGAPRSSGGSIRNASDCCDTATDAVVSGAGDMVETEGEADSRTYIFPGHEYTLNFISFSRDTLPASHPDAPFVAEQLQRYTEMVEKEHRPTIPSTLAVEKRQNLFLRTCDEAFVQFMNKGNTAVELMEYLYNTCP
ncbi:putative Hydroxyacylglutathione hydrolase C terminus [Trypanosoma vivax]|uniref:Putative hydroxyacylglutathione hydrolase n=1 Tax=Trypanosoma vivax (strain Y486) TaxID=1055687 RepID=G0TWC9_TRYVY|nr:putative hydroxyacylglutathione hydrolase [Trypanosoma vivax]KAH8613499.1 putative Hydroxyacylglutathione hydrolase C terminus [Trypanosoma vivax]CCC48267.1 putative hydroxyacylglutathione hydrolase [Trypanosoma vivax Y486]